VRILLFCGQVTEIVCDAGGMMQGSSRPLSVKGITLPGLAKRQGEDLNRQDAWQDHREELHQTLSLQMKQQALKRAVDWHRRCQ